MFIQRIFQNNNFLLLWFLILARLPFTSTSTTMSSSSLRFALNAILTSVSSSLRLVAYSLFFSAILFDVKFSDGWRCSLLFVYSIVCVCVHTFRHFIHLLPPPPVVARLLSHHNCPLLYPPPLHSDRRGEDRHRLKMCIFPFRFGYFFLARIEYSLNHEFMIIISREKKAKKTHTRCAPRAHTHTY